jgi:hypothetical protein
MTKYLVHIFFIIVATLTAVVFVSRQQNTELPIFIRTDEVAVAHESKISLAVPTVIVPGEIAQEQFKSDYANIWAHLNHLYSTNDVEKGKEYYTEAFFRSICKNKMEVQEAFIQREDLSHNVIMQSWSWDGLVCVGIDTNVILKYTVQNEVPYYTKSKVAFALLFQGDHWRIDGIKFIEERKYNKK